MIEKAIRDLLAKATSKYDGEQIIGIPYLKSVYYDYKKNVMRENWVIIPESELHSTICNFSKAVSEREVYLDEIVPVAINKNTIKSCLREEMAEQEVKLFSILIESVDYADELINDLIVALEKHLENKINIEYGFGFDKHGYYMLPHDKMDESKFEAIGKYLFDEYGNGWYLEADSIDEDEEIFPKACLEFLKKVQKTLKKLKVGTLLYANRDNMIV